LAIGQKLCQKIYPLIFSYPIAKNLRCKDQIRESCGSILPKALRESNLEFINSLTIAKGEAEELKRSYIAV
jgi:four helix bundle protein